MRILIPLLVDEIQLPRYFNWFTNFRVLFFYVEMAPFYFKYIRYFLSEITDRDSAWGVGSCEKC